MLESDVVDLDEQEALAVYGGRCVVPLSEVRVEIRSPWGAGKRQSDGRTKSFESTTLPATTEFCTM